MELRDKIKLFPHSPGVYRYYDAEGNVIVFFILKIVYIYIIISLLSSCTINSTKTEVESILSDVLSYDYRIRNHSQENLSSALEVLVKFENKPSLFKKTDLSADVSLAKGVIYSYLGDKVAALNNFKEAKSLYALLENIPSYITAQLYIAKMYSLIGEVSRSLFISELICAKGGYMSPYQLALFIEVRIIAEVHLFLEKKNDIITEYLPSLYVHKLINWNELYTLAVTHDATELAQAIRNNVISQFADYKEYNFTPDIFRIEQEYILQSHTKRYRVTSFFLLSMLSTLILCCLFQLYKLHRDKSIFESELKKAKLIRRKLSLTSDVLHKVDHRLRLLDNYIISVMSGNYNYKANAELLEMLEDKEYFLKSTIDCFLIAHPYFIMYLRELELSDDEMACCCMFASGMKGKDIAYYMGWTRGYDKIAKLRMRLGIKGESLNIDTYLKQKMFQLDLEYQNRDNRKSCSTLISK